VYFVKSTNELRIILPLYSCTMSCALAIDSRDPYSVGNFLLRFTALKCVFEF
jgi:hypothetical protein